MIKIDRHGDVFVLAMQDGENRFNPDNLYSLESALGEVEASEGPAAVVLTGDGKFFSNGLDLEWMSQAPPESIPAVAERSMQVCARLLTFPTAVIAAINGHCFAAGAMMALACDERVMRSDRGFFCLPEVDINLAFTPGMSALITAKLTAQVAHQAMLTGRRYGGEEALAAGIADATSNEVDLLAASVARAQALAGKDRATVAAIKQKIYAVPAELLRQRLDL